MNETATDHQKDKTAVFWHAMCRESQIQLTEVIQGQTERRKVAG